jgi:hypothetical protein
MVFRAGLRESLIHAQGMFRDFQKASRNIPSAWITLYPARKNHSVIVL